MKKDKRKRSFTIIEDEVIENLDITKNELLAYIVLCKFKNREDSTCFPSYATISKLMRCSKQTTLNAIEGLIQKGIIKKTIRKNKKNDYNQTNLYSIVGLDDEQDYVNSLEEKRRERAKQVEELNKNKNVKLFMEIAPHIRLGRKQKMELAGMDFEILDKALDRSMLYGANTFNYVLEVYKSIYGEEIARRYKEEQKLLEEKYNKQRKAEIENIHSVITENENLESDIEVKNKKLLEKDSQDIQRKIFYTNELREYDENTNYITKNPSQKSVERIKD